MEPTGTEASSFNRKDKPTPRQSKFQAVGTMIGLKKEGLIPTPNIPNYNSTIHMKGWYTTKPEVQYGSNHNKFPQEAQHVTILPPRLPPLSLGHRDGAQKVNRKGRTIINTTSNCLINPQTH